MATKDGWREDRAGGIVTCSLVGYATATLPEDKILLRLDFVSRPDQPLETAHALSLVLTRDKAREFGRSVLKTADAPHLPRPATDSRH